MQQSMQGVLSQYLQLITFFHSFPHAIYSSLSQPSTFAKMSDTWFVGKSCRQLLQTNCNRACWLYHNNQVTWYNIIFMCNDQNIFCSNSNQTLTSMSSVWCFDFIWQVIFTQVMVILKWLWRLVCCIQLTVKTMEAGMLYTTDSPIFLLFTNNTWIGDSSALCHITSNYTSLFDIININKLVKSNSGSMSATKKENWVWRCIKSAVVKCCTYYGLWNIASKPVQTFLCSHVKSCRGVKFLVTIKTMLSYSLQVVTSHLMSDSRLVMVG